MSNKRCIAVAELAVNLYRLASKEPGAKSNAYVCSDVASKLTSLEVRCSSFAARCCNDPISEETQGRVLAQLRRRATKQLERLFPLGKDGKFTINGAALRFDVSGDPRGCCLKLHHPDLPKNGFGQDAYNVGA